MEQFLPKKRRISPVGSLLCLYTPAFYSVVLNLQRHLPHLRHCCVSVVALLWLNCGTPGSQEYGRITIADANNVENFQLIWEEGINFKFGGLSFPLEAEISKVTSDVRCLAQFSQLVIVVKVELRIESSAPAAAAAVERQLAGCQHGVLLGKWGHVAG